jgi:hypothetical protein
LSPTVLARWIGGWALVTIGACIVVVRAFTIEVDVSHPRAVVASVWNAGEVVARSVLARAGDPDPRIDAALAARPGSTLVYESVVGEGPVVLYPEVAFAVSFVAGRDGMSASVDGRTDYVTPDELLAKQAYDKGVNLPSVQLSVGLDTAVALALLSERLGTSVRDILDRGRIGRIRVARAVRGAAPARAVTTETMTDADVRVAAIAAGAYLARGVDAQGRFRYLVDAPTNRTLGGYDWPRHAGATYFLAQVAPLSRDPDVGRAALRAASYLRDRAMERCGDDRCIGDGARADLGSTALTVIAFVEVAQGLDPGYALVVPGLTGFLRAQQRADGEFMHLYDRQTDRRIDVQLLYYSGEAALALSRAHSLVGDARDLEAAKRALAHLVGPAWTFFGSRYYWGEEHWTCQAMDDLWNRSPDRSALDFCLGWEAFNRGLQYGPDETPFDAEGAYGFGPLVTPRLTPAGSRSEAAIATLDAARQAGVAAVELDALDRQIRRSLSLLIRQQLGNGPTHMLADPAAVAGALPGSEVDWQLRIDYAQHAGSAMLRWLALRETAGGRERPKGQRPPGL